MLDAGTDIGHVHLKVSDLDRALAFCQGILGFALTGRLGDQAVFVSAGGYHHHIGLNTWESRGGSPPLRGGDRPPSRGDPLSDAADHGVSEAICLHDPDGNRIEL